MAKRTKCRPDGKHTLIIITQCQNERDSHRRAFHQDVKIATFNNRADNLTFNPEHCYSKITGNDCARVLSFIKLITADDDTILRLLSI